MITKVERGHNHVTATINLHSKMEAAMGAMGVHGLI